MPFDSSLIDPAVARYRRERDRYVKLADRVAEICRGDVCEQNAIRAQVTFRVKTEKSFEAKLRRFSSDEHRNYSNIDEIFDSISDLAGVRISAYQYEDCNRIVDGLKSVFRGPVNEKDISIDVKDKKNDDNSKYYRAIHVQVSLIDDDLVGTYDNVGDISCEIQVCTMMAHVWNEIEHDIGYKTEFVGLSKDEAYHLDQLGALVRQGDISISSLMKSHDRKRNDQIKKADGSDLGQEFVDVHGFVSRMRDFYGEFTPSFPENSGQLFDICCDLGIKSLHDVRNVLGDLNFDNARKDLVEFNEIISGEGLHELCLSPETSDLMLISLIGKKLDDILVLLKGRAGRGKGRPTRLHRIVLNYNKISHNLKK
ncbi:GTP pyrophosphokinase [Insolitispirillum peregrinum]|uniref:RelA/SpoT domain-containing protein n=1 Tax=Insolitispirillum peregrinum TaxID=80876 RepID=A0A1N7LKR2_9PROT|nr:hypothetical protein [Insolitispirillum peregrinum]SIS74435.1 hypothetical protein SAMN05421779_103391 [Insolitispirillum peregrinum]